MNDSDKQIREAVNSVKGTPGYQLDKNAAWQKLQFRMQGRPIKNHTRTYYYGIAAAILLICFSLPFLMPKRSTVENTKTEQPSISVKRSITPVPPVEVNTALPVNNKLKPNKLVAPKQTLVSVTTIPLDTVSTTMPDIPAIDTYTCPGIAAEVNNIANKLPVVHINDVAEIVNSMPPTQNNFIITVQHKNRNFTLPAENTSEFPQGSRLRIKL